MIRRGAFQESIGATTDTIDSPVHVNLPKHQGRQTKAVRIRLEDNMKNSNHDTNGIISRLIQSFRSIRLIKATMIWICLSSALGLFKTSISFSIDGSVKRQLLSSQFVDSILFPAEGNADWKWSSERIQNDFSFRQPRVLHVDPQFYALQNAVNEVPQYEAANHEIQISKRARRAKKNLENSKLYRKWQRDPLREGDCEPMKPWQETSFPSCNKMHETDIQNQCKVLTNGGYNTVFTLTDTDGSTHIAKILKYTKDYNDRNVDRVRRDSLIMERATNSDYVVNTYSYCGFSQIIEYGRGGSLYSRIATEYDRLSQNQKLQIATQVSQALVDVHNLEGNNISSMTHGDFASKQYILVDGRLKLSDFNRGRFLRWDTKKQEPCPYTIGKNDGKFRSPEEYKYVPQTAAIDVWALGSILVELTTGEEIWSGYEDEVAWKAIVGGRLPPFREKIKNPSDPINQVLLKAIELCYVYDPKDRPKAAAVLEYLKQESKRFGIRWKTRL